MCSQSIIIIELMNVIFLNHQTNIPYLDQQPTKTWSHPEGLLDLRWNWLNSPVTFHRRDPSPSLSNSLPHLSFAEWPERRLGWWSHARRSSVSSIYLPKTLQEANAHHNACGKPWCSALQWRQLRSVRQGALQRARRMLRWLHSKDKEGHQRANQHRCQRGIL